jgi:hypothetical protein
MSSAGNSWYVSVMSFMNLEQLRLIGLSHNKVNTSWKGDLVKRTLEPMNISAL